MTELHLSPKVSRALTEGNAVVALESTIFSELGLPDPHNRKALGLCTDAIVQGGAEPALTAVLDGVATVGVPESDYDRICGPTRKVAARDIGPAIAQRWPYGATTVSASMRLAAAAGIKVFATGGIGGVHKGSASTLDVSADLQALAKEQVVTVSAGAKVFLDLPGTLEYLETMSVPVLGWHTDHFPAFHAPSSGLPVPHRVSSAAEVVAIAQAHWSLGGGGILLVVPVPDDAGLELDELMAVADQATTEVLAEGISGNAVTPAVLDRLSDITNGATIEANLALATNNAKIAADVATAFAQSAQ